MTREIPLTRGYVALVDDEDFAIVSGRSWQANVTPSGDVYARCADYRDGKCGTLYMARLIAGAGPGVKVDHRNGRTLDNRRSNLRVCSHGDNMKNRRPRRDSGTAFKGLCRHESGRYAARICSDGKRHHIGMFDSAEEAARAYDQKARELHGEFARLNFPLSGALAPVEAEAAELNLDLFEGGRQ